MSFLQHLPSELLSEILGYLNFTDILRVRQTCHKLCEVSKHRSVWVRIYENAATTDVTRLLWLAKPLELYDSSELEDAVSRLRAVELGWLTDTTESVVERIIKSERQIFGLLLVPGGRWVLVVRDSQIDYCDLDEERPNLRPLIFENTNVVAGFPEYEYFIEFVELDQGISGRPSLLEFHISVAYDSFASESPDFYFIQVWRISTMMDGRKVTGLTASLVKSLQIPAPGESFGFRLSLCGPQLLYSMYSPDQQHIICVVVDWTQVRGGTDYVCQYFQISQSPISIIYLLPNNRLMVLCQNPKSCELYDFSSVPQETRISHVHSLPCTTRVPLMWLRTGGYFDPPMVVCGEQIRFIVPCKSWAFAVVLEGVGTQNLQTLKIFEREGDASGYGIFCYGCYRGIEIEGSGKVLLRSYRQPDPGSEPECNRGVIRDVPNLPKFIGRNVGFDEGSGRIVMMVPRGKGFVVLDFALQYQP